MRVLMQVSFRARLSEILFIVGPPDSGKIALLSVILSVLRPDDGYAMANGVGTWSLGANALIDSRLGRAGFVFQDYHLFPCLTTVENVTIPLILRHMAWDTVLDQAVHYLDVVGLKNRTQLPPVRLSGGEQRRVTIACVIVTQPDVLTLDEPTALLDGDAGRSIMQFAKTEILSAHHCIMIMTHDIRILDLASCILDTKDGKLSRIEHGMMR